MCYSVLLKTFQFDIPAEDAAWVLQFWQVGPGV